MYSYTLRVALNKMQRVFITRMHAYTPYIVLSIQPQHPHSGSSRSRAVSMVHDNQRVCSHFLCSLRSPSKWNWLRTGRNFVAEQRWHSHTPTAGRPRPHQLCPKCHRIWSAILHSGISLLCLDIGWDHLEGARHLER